MALSEHDLGKEKLVALNNKAIEEKEMKIVSSKSANSQINVKFLKFSDMVLDVFASNTDEQ